MISALLRRSIPTLAAKPYVPGRLDGRVHLVEGRRGRGKSYSMTYWMWRAWRNRLPVMANWSVDLYRASIYLATEGIFSRASLAYQWLCDVGFRRLDTWDDVFAALDCFVMMDEAHHYIDSRAFRDTPPEFLQWLQQSRKLGCTVVFASQSMEFLDVRVRRLADILWQARIEPDKSGRPLRFWLYGLDPWAAGYSDEVLRDRADFKMQIPFLLDVARLYDTLELIRPPTGRVSFESVLEAYKGRRSRSGGRVRVG